MSNPTWYNPFPSPARLPPLSRAEQAIEAVQAGIDAAEYDTIADTVLYGASGLGAASGIFGLGAVAYDFISGRAGHTDPRYTTPERTVTPPPIITPFKRQKLADEVVPAIKMAPMNTWYAGTKRGGRVVKWNRKKWMRKGRKYAPMRQRIIRNPVAELKYLNNTIAADFSSAAWAFGTLLACQQGTSATQRLGNKIFLKFIEIRGSMVCKTGIASSQLGILCRFIVYHNKQANGALPTGANGVFDADNINSNRYLPLLSRYAVLKDMSHSFPVYNNSGDTITASQLMQFHVVIPCYKVIHYQSNAGTVSDLATDDFGVGLITNLNASCSYSLTCKATFSDA